MNKKSDKKQIVGFTCGAFDLMHAGHAIMLEQCKENCDYLVVGVQSDPSIDRPSKNKPVMSYEERIILVKSNKWVDEIVTYDTEQDLEKLLAKMRPDIRFLGEDWKSRPFTGSTLPIRIKFLDRKHTYSSTAIRTRVTMAEARKRNSTLYLTLLHEMQELEQEKSQS